MSRHLRLEWKPEDLWIGAFWRNSPGRFDIWICILPCLLPGSRIVGTMQLITKLKKCSGRTSANVADGPTRGDPGAETDKGSS